MYMSLSKLWDIVEVRRAWCAVVHGVAKSQTWLSNWKTVRECLTVGFLCAVSYLSWALCSLSVHLGARGAGKPLPGWRSKGWDACIGFPSLAFPFGERDYLWPSFDMDHLLASWPLLLLASLVTCKVWSLDLYLKKLPCIVVYMLFLQNSIKQPCSIRAWVPVSFSLFLSLSLFLADSLERKSRPRNPGNISLFPSFTLSQSTPDDQVLAH